MSCDIDLVHWPALRGKHTRRKHKNQLTRFPHSPQFLLLFLEQTEIKRARGRKEEDGEAKWDEVKPAKLAKCSTWKLFASSPSSSQRFFLIPPLLNSRSMSRERNATQKERNKLLQTYNDNENTSSGGKHLYKMLTSKQNNQEMLTRSHAWKLRIYRFTINRIRY